MCPPPGVRAGVTAKKNLEGVSNTRSMGVEPGTVRKFQEKNISEHKPLYELGQRGGALSTNNTFTEEQILAYKQGRKEFILKEAQSVWARSGASGADDPLALPQTKLETDTFLQGLARARVQREMRSDRSRAFGRTSRPRT